MNVQREFTFSSHELRLKTTDMKYLTSNTNRPIEQQLDASIKYRWPDGLKLAMLMAFVMTLAGSIVFLGCYLAWVKMYGI